MKTVLYAGAALMIGASIYGFVDLKNKSHQKEFNNLYKEEVTKTPLVAETGKTAGPVISEEKKAVTPAKKSKTGLKTETRTETKFLKPVSGDERMETAALKDIEKPVVADQVNPTNDLEKKVVKKKKRISSKLFSRAPIREEIEISDEPLTPAKDERKINKE